MNVRSEGRFVFLWRNPLSTVASMIETWPPWRPTMFRDELFVGLPRLIDAYERPIGGPVRVPLAQSAEHRRIDDRDMAALASDDVSRRAVRRTSAIDRRL